jgi:hypothetical protein
MPVKLNMNIRRQNWKIENYLATNRLVEQYIYVSELFTFEKLVNMPKKSFPSLWPINIYIGKFLSDLGDVVEVSCT